MTLCVTFIRQLTAATSWAELLAPMSVARRPKIAEVEAIIGS